MSTHIGAKKEEIASKVLLPGDPLRAKFIAENFLSNPKCYNQVRGMLGFTGEYNGVKVSVQGTGMGQPSMSIYANELFRFYDVKEAIRIGTIGSIQEELKCREIVLALSASSDSFLINRRFNNMHFAPTCSFKLLCKAVKVAEKEGIKFSAGNVLSSDLFYDDAENWRLWQQYGVLGVEMESAELYTLAKKYNRSALSIFTVSDNIVTKEETSSEEREKSFSTMMKLALEAITS